MSGLEESTNLNLVIGEDGKATVSFSDDGKPKILNIASTELATSCSSVELFWSYPVGAMILIIETPFTKKQQSYAVRISNEHLTPAISNVYRIVDNHEVEVTKTDSDLIFDSDANYQVIVKFQGPPQMTYYGVFIHYKIIPK